MKVHTMTIKASDVIFPTRALVTITPMLADKEVSPPAPSSSSPSQTDAFFDDLRDLLYRCSPEGNKHVQAAVLIKVLIDRGTDTRNQIIGVAKNLNFKPGHIAISLQKGLESHDWAKDAEGKYSNLT
ncbi:hypothetical protein BH10PLA2_BH10PLA2_01030 [soil metagenome]